MEYKFYQTYIKLLDDDFNFRKSRELTEFEKKLKHGKFRSFLLSKIGANFNTITLIEKIMRSGMLRPQRLIIDTDDFYIACDMLTNTYYICYKYLMMIDIDFYKSDIQGKGITSTEDNQQDDTLRLFQNDVHEHPDHCWTLYRTRGGIHAFLNSKSYAYSSEESCNLMLRLGSDFNYVVYSYLRGWCVRLNRKQKEEFVKVEFMCKVGDVSLERTDLTRLVNSHLKLIESFKYEDPCSMYGV